jgi:hypothetical protein
MEENRFRNFQEAYSKVYHPIDEGREDMIAGNIARAKQSSSMSGSPSPTKTPSSSGPTSSSSGSGPLGSLNQIGRSVAGKIGGEIGAQQGKQKYGNVLGIPERIGRNRGTQQGQQTYDKVTGSLGGILKQSYELDGEVVDEADTWNPAQTNSTIDRRRQLFDKQQNQQNQPRPRPSYLPQAKVKKKEPIVAGLDIFDIVKGHLLDEGYADTEESALAIMANMSEEWRTSILEELEQLDEVSLKTKMKAYAATQDPEADYQYGSKVHAQGDRIRANIVKKHGEKAGENADAHAESEHWGRKDSRTGKRQGYAKPRIEKNRKYRTTKSGKMHGQDQASLKRSLQYKRSSRNDDD